MYEESGKLFKKLPVSLCIIARNEAENLPRCLEHIGSAVDEILLLDTGSTDGTQETAERLGAVVYTYQWNGDFSAARNYLMGKTRNDWILWIDGDEYYPPELVEEIKLRITSDEGYNGYYFPRRNYYLGRWLRFGGNYPDYQLKLFKKSSCTLYQNRVHEKILVQGRIGYMKQWCGHYPYPTVESYMEKFRLYTDLEAQRLHDSGTAVSFFNTVKWLIFKPAGRFMRRYVIKGGFVHGIPGFFAAFFDAAGFIVRYIKLWEIQRAEKNAKK